jgi:hypothetical protein
MSKRRSLQTILLLVVLVVSSCSSSSAAITDATVKQARNSLFSTDAGAGASSRAERAHLVIGKCMKRQGFKYERKGLQMRGEQEPPPKGTYGVSFTTVTPPPEIDEGPNGLLSPAYQKAMRGSSEKAGGCLAEGLSIVNSAGGVDEALFQRLYSEGAARRTSDPRVVKLNKNWASCMAESSFKFANPPAIVEFLEAKLSAVTSDFEKQKLQTLERALYAADQKCQKADSKLMDAIKEEFENEVARKYLKEKPEFVSK